MGATRCRRRESMMLCLLQTFGQLADGKETNAASLSAVVTRAQAEAIRKHFGVEI